MDKVLIVDFGSQVTQLIARRVRESGVYCEVVPFNRVGEMFEHFSPKAVILSGGPESVTQVEAPRIADVIVASGVPILGICYGQQALCQQLGGQVEGSDDREFGRAALEIVAPSPLFEGIADKQIQVCRLIDRSRGS